VVIRLIKILVGNFGGGDLNFEIVTFASIGKSYKARNYSTQLMQLQGDLRNLDIHLWSYNQNDIDRNQIPCSRAFWVLRKGAGSWVWKPYVIRSSAAHSPSRYLLYMDVDLRILNLDVPELISSLEGRPAAAFELQDQISDWSSKRCLNFFNKAIIQDFKSYASGLILFDTEHPQFFDWLDTWENFLVNPKLILEPFFSIHNTHRHDQTILSSLVVSGQLKMSKLPSEVLVYSPPDPSEIESSPTKSIFFHARSPQNIFILKYPKFISFLFHKLQLMQFWFIYFASK